MLHICCTYPDYTTIGRGWVVEGMATACCHKLICRWRCPSGCWQRLIEGCSSCSLQVVGKGWEVEGQAKSACHNLQVEVACRLLVRAGLQLVATVCRWKRPASQLQRLVGGCSGFCLLPQSADSLDILCRWRHPAVCRLKLVGGGLGYSLLPQSAGAGSLL